MNNFLRRQPGWLKEYAKPDLPGPEEAQQSTQSSVQVIMKIRCPKCKSDRVKQYGKDRSGNVLYYRCKEINCKEPFKVIEKDVTLQK
jgi:transposase-like protein